MTTSTEPVRVDYNLADPAVIATNERGEIALVQRNALAMQTASFGCVLPALFMLVLLVGIALMAGWTVWSRGQALIPAIFFFSVERRQYDALLADRRYRVYYAPKSQTLLSITPLET